MIISSFPKIVKEILKPLPKTDYPVLNTRLFFECWLSDALDNSLTSMRDLFKRLNNTGLELIFRVFPKPVPIELKNTFRKFIKN
jgi:putative transposase